MFNRKKMRLKTGRGNKKKIKKSVEAKIKRPGGGGGVKSPINLPCP